MARVVSVRNALETLRRRCAHIRQRMAEHPTVRPLAEPELRECERALIILEAAPQLLAVVRAIQRSPSGHGDVQAALAALPPELRELIAEGEDR